MFMGKEFDTLMVKYKEHGKKEEQESEITSMLFQLRRSVERKVSMFWQIESFEHCIQEDIDPFGLRIYIFPLLKILT